MEDPLNKSHIPLWFMVYKKCPPPLFSRIKPEVSLVGGWLLYFISLIEVENKKFQDKISQI